MKLDHDEVTKDPCDDSVVLRLIVHWVKSTEIATGSPKGSPAYGHIGRTDFGVWQLAFAVQRDEERRQRHFVDVDPMATRADRWPLVRLGPGVWDITKSIHVEGQFHGFVTVVGVPEPAPWEGRSGAVTLREQLDIAFRRFNASGGLHEQMLGDCHSHDEGLKCCIDADHEHYDELLSHLATELAATAEAPIATRAPTGDDLVAFAKTWIERAKQALPYTRTSIGLAIYRSPNIAFSAVNDSPEACAEFEEALLDHLRKRRSS